VGLLDPSEAAQLLSDLTAQPYELVGRLPGDESGAHEMRGPDGRRLVAKWDSDPVTQGVRRVGVKLTGRLRDQAGWPVPQQWIVESDTCLFVLQQFLPGHPVRILSNAILTQILELHQGRIGLALPEDTSDWPDQLIQTLIHGGSDYCLHSSLRGYDGRTARLLDRIVEIGRGTALKGLPGADLVHWDLHSGNLLQTHDRLTGIVDTDFVKVGDAAFDLATLAISACATDCEQGVREQLFELAIEPLDRTRRCAYIGHLLLRVLDWAIRYSRTDEVEFWLSQSDRLLPA
jgi:Phosphotransferase enzyme family